MRRRASDDQPSSLSGRAFAAIFALGFGTPGLFLTWILLVQPILTIYDARSWELTTCVITSSDVEASSEGDTFSVEISYTYEVAGVEYRGDLFDFRGPGKTSGYEGKAEIVDSLPPGAEVDCWFDPEDPDSSVIDRGAGSFLLWGLLPFPFLLVGLGAAFVFFTLPKAERLAAGQAQRPTTESEESGMSNMPPSARQIMQRHAADPSDQSVDASALGIVSSPLGGLALEPEAGRKSRVIGLLVVALFWNGIVSVFLWQVGIFEGRIEDGCMTIFMIPFMLVGLALISSFFHQLLNLANPLPHILLSTPRPTPGQPGTLQYRFTGATHRIRRFEIRLLGKESATYRRGTSTSTARHTFYDQALISIDRIQRATGTVDFQWPEDAMPTFIAPNNRIEWSLEVRGEIRFWPDVAEDFPVPIYPPEPRS